MKLLPILALLLTATVFAADPEGFAMYKASDIQARAKAAKLDENKAGLDRVATHAGAKAGKVSGAGGGGFMMFFVDPVERPAVMRALDRHNGINGQVLNCTFTDVGAQSWRKNQ